MNNKVKQFISSEFFLILLGVILITISVHLWQTQRARDLEQIMLSTEFNARSYASETEVRFYNINESLIRLAARGFPESNIDLGQWLDDASFFEEAFSGIESVALVGKDFRIKQIIPEEENQADIGQIASEIENEEGRLNLWIPIYQYSEFQGYIFGTIRLDSLLAPVLEELGDDYMIQLAQEGAISFESDNWEQPQKERLVSQIITLENTGVVNLTIAPTGSMIQSGMGVAFRTFLASVFISSLTLAAVYLAQNFNELALFSASRYQNLFDASRDAIFIVNMKGAYLEANPAAVELLGYSHDELQKLTVNDVRVKEAGFDDGSRKNLWSEGGMVAITLKGKDGSHVPVEMEVSPIKAEGGAGLVMGIARDVSERIRAEKELARYRSHLEELVDERTYQLEKINQELTEYAYVVSHDLKAPLRGIVQLAEWLDQDYAPSLDEDGREMLGLLNNRTRRMHDLVEGILHYSRIGRDIEEVKRVDLEQLMAEVIDSITIPESVTIEVPEHLPTVVQDPTRLRQVFQNLIENAVKYQDTDDGWVKIECVDEDMHWRFSVRDNGPGIEEKYFEKIFQMFQTLEPRDQRENTGVGLAVVKKVVEGWGGEVWVESTVGMGSCFYFTLLKMDFVLDLEGEE